MKIPEKEYLMMWAEMSAAIAGGLGVGAPTDPTTDPESNMVAHTAIKEARVILDDLGIESNPPLPIPA